MQELLEMITAYARSMWRFRWIAMPAAWVIALLGWVGVHFFVMPKYEASAQVYVDTASVLKPLLQGMTVEVNHNEQVTLIARQLRSRSILEEVIEETGFGSQEDETRLPLGLLVEKLRKGITVRGEKTSRGANFVNYYTIGYTNTDPILAEQVVQSLIDAFSENILDEIRQETKEAISFIDQQIAEQSENLAVTQNELRDFKRKHINILPQKDSYYATLQGARGALEELELQIRQTEAARDAIKAQLAITPQTTDGSPVLSSIESRLLALRTSLDQLLLKYTEAHPDVIETRASIAELERQRRSGGLGSYVPREPNPVYQQLEVRLQEVESDLAGLQRRREAYEIRADNLQRQIETLPAIEDELEKLTRAHAANMETYQNFIARRQSMTMSERVDRHSDNLRFRVVEPVYVPRETILRSVRMKRLQLATSVLFLAVVGGLGLAYGLSQLRPTFYSQRMLKDFTGLPVLGVVSQVPTASALAYKRLDRVAFMVIGVMILFAYGAALFVQYKAI